jgi:hypothetical protein
MIKIRKLTDRKVVKIGALAVVCLMLTVAGLSCSRNGGKYPPPGGGPLLSFQNRVELVPDEVKSTNVSLTLRKPVGPTSVSYEIFRARKVEDYSPAKGGVPYEKLPMPRGLDISIKPDEFVAYPNKTYKSTIVIEASPELAKGEYRLFLEVSFDGSRWPGSGWITVNVK